MFPPPSALEIARALIRFPSVTPTDGGALPYLRDLLAQAGFAAEIVPFEAPGTPAVVNLYARFGARSPNLAFAGHTDVVPPGDRALWRFDPFSGEIADGELWGRGACDMKGGVAPRSPPPCASSPGARSRAQSASSSPATKKAPRSTARSSLSIGRSPRGKHSTIASSANRPPVETVADTIKHGRRGSLNGRLAISGARATRLTRISPTIRFLRSRPY